MKRTCRIVIAGAGVVGLTMAALLARLPQRARLQITVIDAQPLPQGDPPADAGLRVSAVSAGNMQMLSRFGIPDSGGLRACPYRDMRVWDAGGDAFGTEALHFSASEVALAELGFIVDDALLRHSLAAALAGQAVELRYAAGIEQLDLAGDCTRLALDDGSEIPADLLIAADGARSAVRRLVGIEVSSWDYPQEALVTHARPEHAHQYTAWQRFLPDGPIALLPLLDGRVSIVWSTAPARVAELLDGTDADVSAALTAASAAVLGDLSVAAPRASFPLRAQHAKRYVQHGIGMIGDAAHTVHPLAGQGANLGLADAASLANAIAVALAAEEWPADLSVLRRYERARRGANMAMLRFTDSLNRLFTTDAGVAALRGSGMRAFNLSGPLKRRAMQVAIGL